MEQAGFTDVRVRELAPPWYRGSAPYALAVSGVKPAAGPSPAAGAVRGRRAGRPAALRGAVRRRIGGGRPVRADRGRARPAEAHRRDRPPRSPPGPNPVLVLWRFSRPHTVIGTALSIVGLYAIAASGTGAAPGLGDLLATLVAGLAVNIAIVGINQVTDVEIDRINKPFLPIAAGDLSLGAAKVIVAVCCVVPLAMGATQGVVETGAVAARPGGRRAVLAAAVPAQAVPGRGVAVHQWRALAGGQPGRVLALRGADRSARVGAVRVRAPVQPRDRRSEGRSGPRGRPPLRHPDLHGAARAGARLPARDGRAFNGVRRDDPDRSAFAASTTRTRSCWPVDMPPRWCFCCTGQGPRIRAITPNSRVSTCGSGRSSFWSTSWSRRPA